MISFPNVTGSIALFTATQGVPRWFSFRLQVHRNGGDGVAEVKINDASIPNEAGYMNAQVDSNTPKRMASTHVLLQDGDVVTCEVQGGSLDVSFSASEDSEEI